MHIDRHTIKVIGTKYDHKKDKRIKDQTIATYQSTENMDMKKFSSLLEEVADSHDAYQDTEVVITLKQYLEENKEAMQMQQAIRTERIRLYTLSKVRLSIPNTNSMR